MPTPQASVVLAIYNRFDYLERVLAGLERQTVRDFEVILADDGSNEQTVASIERYQERSHLRIRHLWHEDDGFRKTIILNRAIQAADSDYLIFVDGDCVPHHGFVGAHLAFRRPGVTLSGRRVELSQQLTDWLTAERIRNGAIDTGFFLRIVKDSLVGDTTHAERGIYLPAASLGRMVPQQFKGLLGCNFSLHRHDMLDINGFDERYLGPGYGEDTDLEFRLGWAGKQFVSVKNSALQYHLYHRVLDRSRTNAALLAGVLEAQQAVTPYGIDKGIGPIATHP